MIKSMTGYGRCQQLADGMNITVEIKSVNHRYFEFSSKLPRSYGFLDEKLKSFFMGKLTRGKMECYVQIETVEEPDTIISVNHPLVKGYLDAYKELADIGGSRLFDVLENAVEASIENMPIFKGTTVIAVDVSGSMGDNISDKSKVRCYEIAMLLGLIANKICENSVFYTFNNDIKKYAISHKNGILETVTNSHCGGVTNMFLPFQKMIDDNIKADRVIILSDNECNSCGGWYSRKPVQSIADEYRKTSGNDIWVHAIDLQGYGTQQFHGAKTNIIAGWSEKVFDFIKIAEQGEGTLEKSIEQYIY